MTKTMTFPQICDSFIEAFNKHAETGELFSDDDIAHIFALQDLVSKVIIEITAKLYDTLYGDDDETNKTEGSETLWKN